MDSAVTDTSDVTMQWIRHARLASRIAHGLGISRAAVSSWRRVPAERVIPVEAIIGIPRYLIRPDLYPLDRPVSAPPSLPPAA